MKTLTKIIIVLLIVIAIPFIVALFVSREFNSEGEIVIHKPKQEVFDYVKYIKNQDNFGVWQLSDPDMKKTEEGEDGTVGFKYSWESEKLGKGKQVITAIVDGESMESDLFFLDFSDDANASYITVEEKSANETLVKWGITGKTPYPWNLMNLFHSMDKDFDQGLENLKEILETAESDDKAKLRSYYRQTFDDLAKSVDGLSSAQLHFKPAPDKWSVIECVEHIVVSEPMLFEWLKMALMQPADPEKKSEVTVKDEEVTKMVEDRSHKATAPAEMTPEGKYQDIQTALDNLKASRQIILDELEKYSMDDLRNRVLDFPAGKADAYQFAMFIAGHTARHRLQIEEIKSDSGFPKD